MFNCAGRGYRLGSGVPAFTPASRIDGQSLPWGERVHPCTKGAGIPPAHRPSYQRPIGLCPQSLANGHFWGTDRRTPSGLHKGGRGSFGGKEFVHTAPDVRPMVFLMHRPSRPIPSSICSTVLFEKLSRMQFFPPSPSQRA